MCWRWKNIYVIQEGHVREVFELDEKGRVLGRFPRQPPRDMDAIRDLILQSREKNERVWVPLILLDKSKQYHLAQERMTFPSLVGELPVMPLPF
jgi:hypothetical protein